MKRFSSFGKFMLVLGLFIVLFPLVLAGQKYINEHYLPPGLMLSGRENTLDGYIEKSEGSEIVLLRYHQPPSFKWKRREPPPLEKEMVLGEPAGVTAESWVVLIRKNTIWQEYAEPTNKTLKVKPTSSSLVGYFVDITGIGDPKSRKMLAKKIVISRSHRVSDEFLHFLRTKTGEEEK